MKDTDRTTVIYLVGTIIMFFLLLTSTNQILAPIFNRGSVSNTLYYIKAPEQIINENKTYKVKFNTSEGSFEAELCSKCAPKNVNNFVYLSKNKYFDQTKFSRIVKDFLIQAGDPQSKSTGKNVWGTGKTTYFIEDEVNWNSLNISESSKESLRKEGYKSNDNLQSISLKKYALAMANDGPNTNSSQFFIIVANNSDSRLFDLNGKYTVIGEIKTGIDAVNKINDSQTSKEQVPDQIITINSTEVTEL